ncbi:MAG: hypothetical protein K0B52_06700, partial [FCB group bacterium]|nr:hypothetical protein [FCB group bacterium]
MKRILALLLLVLGTGLIAEDEIVRISLLNTESDSSGQYVLLVHIKEGWHINSAAPLDDYYIPAVLDLAEPKNATIADVIYPPGKIKSTRWGGDLSLYEGELQIPFRIETDAGTQRVKVKFTYQACDDMTCLTPEAAYLEMDITRKISAMPQTTDMERTTQVSQSPATDPGKTGEAETGPFADKGLFVVLLLVFVMGLALNLTPCVYPLIPVTMGYFLAQKDTRSPVLLAVLYVSGLAITYS